MRPQHHSLNQFLTLVDGIEHMATQQGTTPALRFIAHDGSEQELTFADISQRSRTLAAYLQQHYPTGSTALILYPSGVEYIICLLGCFYAGIIGVPVNLPGAARVKRVLAKLDNIANDCGASLVLTGGDIVHQSGTVLSKFAEIQQLDIVETDRVMAMGRELTKSWQPPSIDADTIAFLQYTSGSTGQPKGVVNRHRNLLANLAFLACLTRPGPETIVLSWLPLYHDLGLIMGILSPLIYGNTAIYFAPTAFVADPLRWLELASEAKATVLPGPNFALQRCTDAANAQPHRLAQLDLSSVVSLVPTAEPVSAQQVEAFYQCFKACGLHRQAIKPSYGLAEATLIAAGNTAPDTPVYLNLDKTALTRDEVQLIEQLNANSRRYVGCGNDFGGQDLRIVDPVTRLTLSADRIGEIWVSGPAVADGYWQREQATQETFYARTAESNNHNNYLRTGDLGFIHDGQVYITGRLKDVLIYRGQCHYPNDIEATATEAHSDAITSGAAAFSFDDGEQERLVLVIEVQRHGNNNMAEFSAAIRSAVAKEHQLKVWKVVPIRKGTLLRTTSGKVRRRDNRTAWQQQKLHVLWTESIAGTEQKAKTTTLTSREAIETLKIEAPTRDARTERLTQWICQAASEVLATVSARNIDTQASLFNYGLDSIGSTELLNRIHKQWEVRLTENSVFDHASPQALAALLEQTLSRVNRWDHDRPLISASTATSNVLQNCDEPIAIIGMAYRLPGADGEEAQNDESFWRLLHEGKSAIRPMPPERYRFTNDIPGFGAFLNRPADFDAGFFGMSPREAINTDPQQRLLLEVAWHTLEDAGLRASALQKGDVGVFVGIGTGDYSHIPFITCDASHLDAYYGTGNSFAAACGRLSYFFGWEGPSVAVDTACSSSHSALHMACQALRLGECEMAMAAGIKLQLLPEVDQVLHKAGMLALDGQCKTFDAAADGYVRGEGCVAFMLKPLSTARADGDPIRAVIRGSLVRQDGASSSLSAPNGDAQRRLLERVLSKAGLTPDEIDYLELHGTGTRLGDPIEYQSVAEVFSGRQAQQALRLGSVKTNIGHLEAAAGASALVKTVLALEKGVIPPHAGLSQLNPLIDLDLIPAKLSTVPEPWPQNTAPRRAGVTSYGFAGTLAHVVLEQAPPASNRLNASQRETAELFMLSARSAESLNSLRDAWIEGINHQTSLPALASSMARLRDHHPLRMAVVASDHSSLLQTLQDAQPAERITQAPRVGFMFTGQGAQYLQMGRVLYQTEPAFRTALDEAETALSYELGESLLNIMHCEDLKQAARLNQTQFTQPALFAIGYALARLWQAYGVQPTLMIGHSIGEFAALVIAGAITLPTAARLIVLRGALMQSLPEGGGMLATRLTEEAATQLLRSLPQQQAQQVSLAALNGQQDTVISGAKTVLEYLRTRLEQQDISARPLQVSHAFHSPLLEPMLEKWHSVCQDAVTQPPQIAMISTLSGQPLTGAPDANYWREHARQPVRFSQALEQAATQCDVLLEIGPHAILTALAQRNQLDQHWQQPVAILASMRRNSDELKTQREAMRELYLEGQNFAWDDTTNAAFSSEPLSPRTLPRYPFNRQTYWLNYDSDAPREPLPLQPQPESGEIEPVPLYTLQWEPIDVPPALVPNQRLWLCGNSEKCQLLAHALRAFNAEVLIAAQVKDLAVNYQIGDTVIYATPASETSTPTDNTWKLIEWVQNIQQQNITMRMLLVTQGAQCIDDEACQPHYAALWGAARALAIEYPACKWLMLDIAQQSNIQQLAANIMQATSCFESNDALAVRGEKWLHPRLTPVSNESMPTQMEHKMKPTALYLVAGAWGALGRHITEWLISHGARHLVLTSRQPARPSQMAVIEHWRGQGINITCIETDITDNGDVAALFTHIDAMEFPLEGIFHCAGVGRFNPLKTITQDDYLAVTKAKIIGTQLLHQHTQHRALNWFVCFTSIAGVWGSRLQIHYGAANAWQDALIRQRRHQGLAGISISWGPWSGGAGMSEVDASLLQYLRKAGIQRQSPMRYLATLNTLFCAHQQNDELPAAWLAAEVDWSKFVPLFSLYNHSDMFRYCLEMHSSAAPESKEQHQPNAIELGQLAAEAQRVYVKEFVRNELARTLSVAPHNIQPDAELLALGMDSILVMDFARRCDEILGIHCSLKSLFEHNTPARLTKYLLQQIETTTQGKSENTSSALTIVADQQQRYEPFPLTELQYAYWIGRQDHYALGGIACHAYLEADAAQGIDCDLLERCWNTLIIRHDALRLIIEEDGRQRVLENVPAYQIKIANIQRRKDISEHCDNWRNTLSHQVLETNRWPLFDLRVSSFPDGSSRLHISIDMLINDAASSQILWDELVALYRAGGDLAATALTPLSITFRDYVLAKHNRDNVRQDAWEKARDYWISHLPTLPAAPQLPLRPEALNTVHPQFTRRQRKLSAPAWEKLCSRAKQQGTTPASLLIGVFAEVLAAWSAEPRFSLNLTIFDRLPWHPDVPNLVGDFTAVTLLALDCGSPISFAERAAQINGQILESLEHRAFSAVDVLREWNRGREQQDLISMPVVFTSQLGVNDPTKGAAENPLGEIAYGISQTPQVWLDHQASEQNGALVYNWDAVEDIFPAGVLDAMFTSYGDLLEQLAENETLWKQPLPSLLPVQQRQVRDTVNRTDTDLPNVCLDELFFVSAARFPDAIALTSEEGCWRYSELENWIRALAHQTLEAGISRGDRIAVVMHKGVSQVAACLAIQRAGAAYVPLDSAIPELRLQAIMQGSDIRLVMTQPQYAKSLRQRITDPKIQILVVDAAVQPTQSVELPPQLHKPEDAAYVIYTSGSTGTPKGVLIDHRGAVNTVLDINKRFQVTGEDVVLGISSLYFDLSVYDMFGTFAAGGTLVLPDAEGSRDPAQWLLLVKHYGVTVWNSVPALLDLLLDEAENEANALIGLRKVFLSGDWIPLPLPARLNSQAPEARLVAMGGATEASIWSNWFNVVQLEPHWNSIPYGYPLSNQSYRVLDSQLRDRPDYVTGDLFIGGTGLALGYENDPEKTAASFITHPKNQQRLYRTGDLARYWPDGTLEFLGRSDYQLKIAGNRIEPGEIEAALLQHPEVREAVVDTLGKARGEKRLAAWVVLHPESPTLNNPEQAAHRLDAEQITDTAKQQFLLAENAFNTDTLTNFWALIDALGHRMIVDTLTLAGARYAHPGW